MIKILALVLFVTSHIFSNTGYNVMKKVYDENKKKSTRKAVIDMMIYDKQDRERSRYFNYWVKFTDSDEKSLIKFFRPKNIKGTSLLTDSNTDTNVKLQWIFLPAFKSLKRLTSSDSNKSFMGSDFTYSDIAGRKLDQDKHELVKESDKYFFIQTVPKDISSSNYSKVRYVISKEYSVVIKAVYYDLDGKQLKTLTNSKISQVNDVNVVMESEMMNHQTGGRTNLIVKEIEIGIPIDDHLLSIKGLQTQ